MHAHCASHLQCMLVSCTVRASDHWPRIAGVMAGHGDPVPHPSPTCLLWVGLTPLLLFHVCYSISSFSPKCLQGDPALRGVRKVAAEVTARCLRRWDSFLAIRAGKDSLGRQAGIWKDKFESVRGAALLLAFRMVNTELQRQALRASPGGLDPPGIPLIRRYIPPSPPSSSASRRLALSCCVS